MAKIKIFHASVAPLCYDLKKIATMDFDEAVEFFKNDEVGCCTTDIDYIDTTCNGQYIFHADGVFNGDGSDTMFNWIKVEV